MAIWYDELKKDIHEQEIEYLQKGQVAAEFCTAHCGWERIERMSDGAQRSIEDIHTQLF